MKEETKLPNREGVFMNISKEAHEHESKMLKDYYSHSDKTQAQRDGEREMTKVRFSDKTWEERFQLRFERQIRDSNLGFDEQDGEKQLLDFISKELTSATIKAKEEVLRDLLQVKMNGIPSIEQEVHRVLAFAVLDYAKLNNLNLEEPSK